jgi:hypothetical protein
MDGYFSDNRAAKSAKPRRDCQGWGWDASRANGRNLPDISSRLLITSTYFSTYELDHA